MKEKFMREALKEAQKALEKEEVPVGAIIVKDGKIIARAHNTKESKKDSTCHAELLAIKKACKKLDAWRLLDCEMYVTLEPCSMCAGALINSRIKKIYIGTDDGKTGACGSVLNLLEDSTCGIKKYVFVHNLSFEFNFMRNILKYKSVFSRKARKVIKCELLDYNIEFRCTYYMTNVKLERLSALYNLPVQKLSGTLDYTKIRHSESYLARDELQYCENDSLVIYYYIKLQLEQFKNVNRLPLTSTGFVRKELKSRIYRNYKYKNKVKRAINTNGHIFNLLESAFMRWVYSCKLD